MKTSINLKLLACINLFLLDNSRPLIRTAIRVTMTLRKSPAGSGDTKLCKVWWCNAVPTRSTMVDTSHYRSLQYKFIVFGIRLWYSMFGSVQLQQKSFRIGCFSMEKMSRHFSDAVVMQLSHSFTDPCFDRGIMLAQSCSQDVEDPAYKKPSDCKSIPLFQKLSMTKALVWPLRWPFKVVDFSPELFLHQESSQSWERAASLIFGLFWNIFQGRLNCLWSMDEIAAEFAATCLFRTYN